MRNLILFCLLLAGAAGAAGAAPAPENLAAGKPVRFLPAPNYSLTAKGGSDAADLTDGALCPRPDQALWFDSRSVGFSYPGLQQIALDLGAEQPIGEVAIRLQGGSPQPGISFPVWVDLLASLDGEQYYRLASFSRWNGGDRAKFGVPAEAGKAWVHRLAFRDLRVRARYVGLSFYGTGHNVSDELWVLRGPDDAPALRPDPEAAAPFCVEGAQVYFHKPVMHFSTNIATPNPVGFFSSLPKDTAASVRLDLPAGLRLAAGALGGVEVASLKPEALPDGTRYVFPVKAAGSNKAWGRLYLAGDWRDGREGDVRYQVSWEGGQSPEGRQRLRAVRIPEAPRPKRLLTGMGWWGLTDTRTWPDGLAAIRTLGFSTVPLFARWVKEDADWQFLEKARAQGFKVVSVDSPFHEMLSRHANSPDLMCQLPAGPGKSLCPSYRGPAYQEEIERLARAAARAKPDLFTADIELWSWTGPTDAQKCTRCQADFAQSGLKEWKEWQVARGVAIWKEMVEAVRKASREAGGPLPECGGYDFRPGQPYQFFWSVDRLAPEWMHGSEVSTYTPLEPYHLALIGDGVRTDRRALKGGSVIPWLTPGDAGVFPGRAFRDSLLECLANGARGLLFWSSRVWDTETLAAYADAIRIAAPAEDVIVEGDVLEGAGADAGVRLSGMRKGDAVFLLVADYAGALAGPASVKAPVQRPCRVTDLETGKVVGRVTPDAPAFPVRFEGTGARAFLIRP